MPTVAFNDWRHHYPTDRIPGGSRTPVLGKHPKARFVTEDGLKFVLPYAPTGGTHDGFAGEYAALDRPGRKPYTVRTANGLRTCAFSIFLGYRDHQRSVEPLLKTLAAIAESGERVTISLSRLEAGVVWNMTGMSVNVILRQHGSNDVTRCTVDLTFTEDVDAAVNVGPLSGGKGGRGDGDKGPDLSGNPGTVTADGVIKKGGKGKKGGGKKGGKDGDRRPGSPGSKGKNTKQRHVVTKGQSLAEISLLYYGTPNAWKSIAEASDVRDVRKKNIKPGTRLVIPPAKRR